MQRSFVGMTAISQSRFNDPCTATGFLCQFFWQRWRHCFLFSAALVLALFCASTLPSVYGAGCLSLRSASFSLCHCAGMVFCIGHHIPPFYYVIMEGRHIHHLVFGIFILLVAGYGCARWEMAATRRRFSPVV